MTQTELLTDAHLIDARSIAASMFGRPDRRQWLVEAENTAIDAARRASRKHIASKGQFGKFMSAVVRLALRGLLTRKLKQVHKQPRRVPFGDDTATTAATSSWPADMLTCLTECQRDVIYRRFQLSETFREIAKGRGTSKPSAFRLYQRAIRRLQIINAADG